MMPRIFMQNNLNNILHIHFREIVKCRVFSFFMKKRYYEVRYDRLFDQEILMVL